MSVRKPEDCSHSREQAITKFFDKKETGTEERPRPTVIPKKKLEILSESSKKSKPEVKDPASHQRG